VDTRLTLSMVDHNWYLKPQRKRKPVRGGSH
jgi:hypothetical protein